MFYSKLNGLLMVGQGQYHVEGGETYLFAMFKRNHGERIGNQKFEKLEEYLGEKKFDCFRHQTDLLYCSVHDYDEYYMHNKCDLGHEHR